MCLCQVAGLGACKGEHVEDTWARSPTWESKWNYDSSLAADSQRNRSSQGMRGSKSRIIVIKITSNSNKVQGSSKPINMATWETSEKLRFSKSAGKIHLHQILEKWRISLAYSECKSTIKPQRPNKRAKSA